MGVLKINNVSIHTPSSMSVDRFYLSSSDSGRTQRGRMINNVVGKKVKLNCTWSGMTWDQVRALYEEVERTYEFQVRYPDPKEGWVTKTMYVGDRTSPLVKVGEGDDILWNGIGMNFIEI